MTQRMDYNATTPAGGCAYCIDMHSRDLLKDGMAVEKLVLVPAWRGGAGLFDNTERAALTWAETVTRVVEAGAPDGECEAVAARRRDTELQ